MSINYKIQKEMDDTVENLTRLFEESLKDFDQGDYMALVANAMEIVEMSVHSPGERKKELVMKLIMDYVEKQNIPILSSILTETTVSNLIEILIKVSKNVVHVQTLAKPCLSFFGC